MHIWGGHVRLSVLSPRYMYSVCRSEDNLSDSACWTLASFHRLPTVSDWGELFADLCISGVGMFWASRNSQCHAITPSSLFCLFVACTLPTNIWLIQVFPQGCLPHVQCYMYDTAPSSLKLFPPLLKALKWEAHGIKVWWSETLTGTAAAASVTEFRRLSRSIWLFVDSSSLHMVIYIQCWLVACC